MTDDQLAGFGFTIYEYETSPKIVMYGVDPWIRCLSSLVIDGGDGLFDYFNGTKKLLTARTGFVIAKAFIKRTWGWISVAIAIYDYKQCMDGK